MEGGKVNINILDIVLFASAALIFQAGWMIDFSLTKKVYVPFLFKTYQISGEVWFFIAYSYLIIGGVILELTITNLFFIPFYLVYIVLVIFISYNRRIYLKGKINLTVYGQRWNILFYSAILVLIVGLFVSGVF
jgi:hypothetical protein